MAIIIVLLYSLFQKFSPSRLQVCSIKSVAGCQLTVWVTNHLVKLLGKYTLYFSPKYYLTN